MSTTNARSRMPRDTVIMNIVIVGFMAALVYVGNYMQIKIPNGILGVTRIHLGNSMCLLAGLLFGRRTGGLSSGIGAALYDLFDPVFITSAPYTFISKFAMGFTAGHISKSGSRSSVITGAVVGQLVYIVLYIGKKIVSQLLLGEPMGIIMDAIGVTLLSSVTNAVISCAISIPLYFALSKALMKTGMAGFINGGRRANAA